MEALEKPGQLVPIFATVIEIVRLVQTACRSENDRPCELFEAVVAKAAVAPSIEAAAAVAAMATIGEEE